MIVLKRLPVLLLLTLAALMAPGRAQAYYPGVTTLVSVDSAGNQTDGPSNLAVISADGRWVAFETPSPLTADDTNSAADVYVHDLQTGATERVSPYGSGVGAGPGYAVSFDLDISDDGRYVTFASLYTNGPSDVNNAADVLVYDRQLAVMEFASVDSFGYQLTTYSYGGDISGDGRYVAFESGGAVYVRDRLDETLTTVGSGSTPAISADGAFVAYASSGIVVWDRVNLTTSTASVNNDGNPSNGFSQNPAISQDGRFVTFASFGSNLVPGDTNGLTDVFVRDRQLDTTTRVNVDSAGNQVVSGFGPTVPAISADGRFVAFGSDATNLVDADTNGVSDIFVHDRQTGATERASVDSAGSQGNGYSGSPGINGDGSLVSFSSFSSNLVFGDVNNVCDNNFDMIFEDNCSDIFVHGCLADRDCDGFTDSTETACGSDPQDPASIPERTDRTGDDNLDTFVDEPLPPGSEPYDCDGDGFIGTVEAFTGTEEQAFCPATPTANDEDVDAWPPDFNDSKTVTLVDVLLFRPHFNTSPPSPNYDPRFDLNANNTINLQDVLLVRPHFKRSCVP